MPLQVHGISGEGDYQGQVVETGNGAGFDNSQRDWHWVLGGPCEGARDCATHEWLERQVVSACPEFPYLEQSWIHEQADD